MTIGPAPMIRMLWMSVRLGMAGSGFRGLAAITGGTLSVRDMLCRRFTMR